MSKPGFFRLLEVRSRSQRSASSRRPSKTANFDQTRHDEEPVGALLVQAPSTMPTRKGRRQMNLNDRPTDDVPTGASDFGDMTVFVRYRPGWRNTTSWIGVPPKAPLLIDCGLLGHQFLSADDIRRIISHRDIFSWRP